MSEMKDRWFWAYPTESVDCDGITGSAHEVYAKSDVDEKIDELEERIDELQKATDSAWSKVNTMYDELRYQKYKRCLGEAKICENKLGTVVKPGWWDKWHKRWLELAEKFKEAK